MTFRQEKSLRRGPTRRYLTTVGAAAIVFLAGLATVQAESSAVPEPINVSLQFGTETGDMVITPNTLVFETGKLYRLVFENPSDVTHYFTPPRFGKAVKTRNVEVTGGKIQGSKRYGGRNARRPSPYRLTEIEIRPGGSAEWSFEPVQAGAFDFQCSAPAHANAGMAGKIVVN